MPAVPRSPAASHPPAIRTLHWLTLMVLVLTFTVILGREGLEDKGTRQWTLALHRYLGVLIWLLACVRLWVRRRQPMADTLLQAPRWQRRASSAMHALLYALLLGVPLLGLALSNARGQPLWLPLLGALPAWPAMDLDLAETLEEWHGAAAWALTALVGAHAAVALWHHCFLRDDVLLAMFPRARLLPAVGPGG